MSETTAADLLHVPQACYNAPQNVSAKADYNDGICDKMLLDSHYTGAATKINAAKGLISDFRDAILVAASGARGTVAARNVAEKLMENAMDVLLTEIQTVANGDPVNAITNITSLGVSYRVRQGYSRDSIEVKNGEISGSFDMYIKRPKGMFAVIFMVTTSPDNADSWKLADFSQNSHGFADGFKKGTTYYFKARYKSSKTGLSDWTVVVDIVCL